MFSAKDVWTFSQINVMCVTARLRMSDAVSGMLWRVRAWQLPEIPEIAGGGGALRLFDTATGQFRPTSPGRRATMYVCGITPYDATHMGHAATYVAFDLVNRIWRDAGHEVCYAQNVTDVDDPLLERAVADGEDWRALAERETEVFREDMAALRVVPPNRFIGAVESIPAIAQTIVELQQRDAVYSVEDDLYFSIAKDPRFGEVSGLDRKQMTSRFTEMGGDPTRPGKRDPLDPLLWQSARPGDPAWRTELGRGRPGWHVECASIATEYLGMPIDIQGGGRDLTFPHHEMCAAMAETAEAIWPFARHYVHTGMVGFEGHKMSKSRGNLVFVRDLRAAGHNPNALRLALLSHHYRSDWEWTVADLIAAEVRLSAWQSATSREVGPKADLVIKRIRECLTDDLDAVGAMRAVDDWAQEANRGLGSDESAGGALSAAVDALLGIEL
jgi:L-cysteine:1D-myo-inositol 2-amino-2-deoxy-alpha-D-glucopyranoside ligase